MARTRQIIETVTCDICGESSDDVTTIVLGWGNDRWELDLCRGDNEQVSSQFDTWIANGRRVRGGRSGSGGGGGARRGARTPQADDDWAYLESLGFKRHRGRKSAEEQAALDNRPQ